MWKVRKLNQWTIDRESFDAINHANRGARCKISQFHVGFHMVMPLISSWYIDIHEDISTRTYIHIFYIRNERERERERESSIFETKDERQSGWLQPCAIDYLLTINWLVLIFAHTRRCARLSRYCNVISPRSSKNHRANSGQTIISNHCCRTGRKTGLSPEFATAWQADR